MTKLSLIKNTLSATCILTFSWLVLWGSLLEREPSKATIIVLSICWMSFSALVFLRLVSFLAFLRGRSCAD